MESLALYQRALESVKGSEQDVPSLPPFPANFPSVKRIPGTRFIVDGFRAAGEWSVSYFLSHFHSDHYVGLTPAWDKGLVFCSEITSSLLLQSKKVDPAFVIALPLRASISIDGCQVVLVDANHCPGAVQILFTVPAENFQPRRYVHTGDMRYAPSMRDEPCLREFVGADAVFLDTTYCNPKYVFPSQQESVDYVAETVFRLMHDMHGVSEIPATDNLVEEAESAEAYVGVGIEECTLGEEEAVEEAETGICASTRDKSILVDPGGPQVGMQEGRDINANTSRQQESILFLISTYVIGKEKILTAVANRCKCRVYVEERKYSLLKCLNLEDFGVFTSDSCLTNVHVVGWNVLGETWPYFRPNFINMERIMRDKGVSRVVGFVPTGWTYETKQKTFSVRRKGPLEIHLVPYSEHSNYVELREYVGFLRPKSIIPTVGRDVGESNGKAAAAILKHFRNLVDETASKRNFLKGFNGQSSLGSVTSSSDTGGLLETEYDVSDPSALIVGATPGVEGCSGAMESKRGAPETEALPSDALLQVANTTIVGSNVVWETESSAQASSPTAKPTAGPGISLAALGLGSRKRKSHTMANDLSYQGQGWEDSQLSTQRFKSRSDYTEIDVGPQLFVQAKSIPGDERERELLEPKLPSVGISKRVIGESGKLACIESPVDALAAEPVSLEAQLKSILPDWVTKQQVQRLLVQAKDDVNAALIQFFEQETTFRREIVDRVETQQGSCHMTSSQNRGPSKDLKRKANGAGRQDGSKNKKRKTSTLLKGSTGKALFEKKFTRLTDEAGTPMQASQGSPVATQHASLSQSSWTKSQVGLSMTNVAASGRGVRQSPIGKLKQKKTAEGRRQGTQSTLLNFFARASSLVKDTEEEKKPTLHNASDSAPSQTSPGDQNQENLKEKSKELDNEKSWETETQQLLLVLERRISEEEAREILGKTGGDVARAIDMVCDSRGPNKPSPSLGNLVCSAETPSDMVETDENNLGGITAPKADVERGIQDVEATVQGVKDTENMVAMPIAKYIPVDHACWKAGMPAPYLHLARAFELIQQETGRLKTTDMLCNMFRSLLALSPEDVLAAVYLTLNRTAPEFENTQMNIGGSTVAAAISEVTGTLRPKLREMYNSIGDLGDVAQACRQTQSMLKSPPPLTIQQVFSALQQISKTSGSGSAVRKKGLVLQLLRACREKEIKFIVRTLVQNMRIGAMIKTVLPALAQAVVLHWNMPCNQATEEALDSLKPQLQDASTAIVEAFNFFPNLDVLIPKLLTEGIGALYNVTVCPGTPIKPMLAKITNGIAEVQKRFKGRAFTCEYKYDGQRAQIHLQADGSIQIFSRDCDDTTSRFPDVVNIVRDAKKPDATSFILDAEIVAVDRVNGNKLLAFQHLSTRERGGRDGTVIDVKNIKVDVCLFIFDIMYANGTPLMKLSFRERRNCMLDFFPNIKPGFSNFASNIIVEADEVQPDSTTLTQRLEVFLDEAFSASCEGFMAKALDEASEYAASKRADTWLKVKRDYVEGLHDTLDLVPIGAWHGSGRKAGWYSPFLLACYNPEQDEFQSVCRVMTGFTDVFYRKTKEFFSGEKILPRKPPYYKTKEEPDVWFSAEVVWEIRGSDLTLSPVHEAAIGLIHESRGISMRFPRFISERSDKMPESANTPLDIVDLFNRQTRKLEV